MCIKSYRFVPITAAALALLCGGAQSDEQADRMAAAEKFAGTWVLSVQESDGASTADNDELSKGLALYPHYLTLKKSGDYKRTHSNLFVSEAEEGTFSVVRVERELAAVDISVTLIIRGDGPKRPATKFVRKEVWRLRDADTLQRCFPADPKKQRPEKFKTKKGDGLILQTYKRVKE